MLSLSEVYTFTDQLEQLFKKQAKQAIGSYDPAAILDAINSCSSDINAPNLMGETALQVALKYCNYYHEDEFNQDFVKANLIAHDNFYFQIIELILKKGGKVNIVCENEETLLHLAARAGNWKIIGVMLVNSEKELIYIKNKKGETALHMASSGYYQHSRYYNLFEKHLENENILEFESMLEENYCKTIKCLLISGADINAKNKSLSTPLHYAVAISRNVSITELLLKHGAGLLDIDDRLSTVLHLALSRQANTYKLTQFLLQQKGCEKLLNLADDMGNYPLHVLSLKEGLERTKLCELLFKQTNINLNILNKDLETPLFYAIYNADPTQVKFFLNNINVSDINNHNILDETLLYKALTYYIETKEAKKIHNLTPASKKELDKRKENLKAIIKLLLNIIILPDSKSIKLAVTSVSLNRSSVRRMVASHKGLAGNDSFRAANLNKQIIKLTFLSVKEIYFMLRKLSDNFPEGKERDVFNNVYRDYNDFTYENLFDRYNSIDSSTLIETYNKEIIWARENKYKIRTKIFNCFSQHLQLILQINISSGLPLNSFDIMSSTLMPLIKQYKALNCYEKLFYSLRYVTDKERISYVKTSFNFLFGEQLNVKQIIQQEIDESFIIQENTEKSIDVYYEEKILKLTKALCDYVSYFVVNKKNISKKFVKSIVNDIESDCLQLFCSSEPEKILDNKVQRELQLKNLITERSETYDQSHAYITSKLSLQGPVRIPKTRTLIQHNDQSYALINKINKEEAEALLKQTGLETYFEEGESNVKFTVGKGNYGKLRLAQEVKLDAQGAIIWQGNFVAVKKIKTEEKIIESKEEGYLQSCLNGLDHIMPLLSTIETNDSNGEPVLYQFMPLGCLDGRHLQKKLVKFLDFEHGQEFLLYIVKAALLGVRNMHSRDIYHLDVKLDNLVFDKQGNLYLIDFGCAKKLPHPIIKEHIKGDVRYFSPERLAHLRTYWLKAGYCLNVNETCEAYNPEKVDAWALGIMFFELIFDDYPFDEYDKDRSFHMVYNWDQSYFQKKLNEKLTTTKFTSSIKTDLLEVIIGLLQVDPKLRLSADAALKKPIFCDIASVSLFNDKLRCAQIFREINDIHDNHFNNLSTRNKTDTSVSITDINATTSLTSTSFGVSENENLEGNNTNYVSISMVKIL